METKNLISIAGRLSSSHHDMFCYLIRVYESRGEKELNIYVNSAGGDSNVSVSIYQKILRLREQGWRVVTYGDRAVKSGGFLIFLAGERRIPISGDTQFMYHNHFKQLNVKLSFSSVEDILNSAKKHDLISQAKTLALNNKRLRNEVLTVTGMSPEEYAQYEDQDFGIDVARKLGILTK